MAEDLDTNKKQRGKPKFVPRIATGTSNDNKEFKNQRIYELEHVATVNWN